MESGKAKNTKDTTYPNLILILKVTDALRHVNKLKWKWTGHVTRLRDYRWTVTMDRARTSRNNEHKSNERMSFFFI